MGATKHYHPISLHALRGAAEWGGFKFGTIRQIDADPEALEAYYAVQLKEIPNRLAKKSPEAVKEALQGCYAPDVTVIAISYNTNIGYSATLHVDLMAVKVNEMGDAPSQVWGE